MSLPDVMYGRWKDREFRNHGEFFRALAYVIHNEGPSPSEPKVFCFDMGTWVQGHGCKTAACIAGTYKILIASKEPADLVFQQALEGFGIDKGANDALVFARGKRCLSLETVDKREAARVLRSLATVGPEQITYKVVTKLWREATKEKPYVPRHTQ